ncbi:hypothetical protein ACFV5C_22645, partial [Streptomyces sp. NPDC059762]
MRQTLASRTGGAEHEDAARDGGGVRGPGPLIVTEDVVLLDDLLRLCAAAGVEPEVHHRVPERRASWTDPPLVLVGEDAAARCRGATRRPGVVLVGRAQDDPEVWRLAVEVGADSVLRLPGAESRGGETGAARPPRRGRAAARA